MTSLVLRLRLAGHLPGAMSGRHRCQYKQQFLLQASSQCLGEHRFRRPAGMLRGYASVSGLRSPATIARIIAWPVRPMIELVCILKSSRAVLAATECQSIRRQLISVVLISSPLLCYHRHIDWSFNLIAIEEQHYGRAHHAVQP